ncbi:MAG: beta-galactosidase trimerization domain-containing protein, partial [Armatimonadetes bacterium]|nr:beta-galactosidase trimerization domain-containing protein [Armatimonadota bacterium]
EFSVSVWADALLLKGAEAIATYTHSLFTGEPAIARHHWGQGTVYTLGTYGEPALYDTLFSRMLDEAGVETMAGMPEGVDACWREKEGARYLIAVNLTGEEKSVPVPDASTPLLGNAPQHGIVSLPPYEVGVYKVQQ